MLRETLNFGMHARYYGAQSPLMELELAKSVSVHESHDAHQMRLAYSKYLKM
jgi:hypothetical protein